MLDGVHVTIDGSDAPGLQIDGASTWRVGFGGGGGGSGAGIDPRVDFGARSVWGGGRGGYATGGAPGTMPGGGGGGAGAGGAVFVFQASLVAIRSTFVANEAVGGRAGVPDPGRDYLLNGLGLGAVVVANGVGTITESTFWGNVGGSVAVVGAYIDTMASSQISLGSTIVAGTAGEDCAVSSTGGSAPATFTSLGHNLIQTPGSCPLGATDLGGVDPMLGSFADHGGPTMTLLPASTSPALGAGMCTSSTDQRGRARSALPICDIGAVELDRASVELDAGTLDGGIRDAMVSDGGETGDTSTFDAAMFDAGMFACGHVRCGYVRCGHVRCGRGRTRRPHRGRP